MFYNYLERNYKVVLNVLLACLFAYVLLRFTGYLAPILSIFFLGLVMFMIFEPIALFLQRKGMRKIIATILAVSLVSVVIIGVLATIGMVLAAQILTFAETIPMYAKKIEYLIDYGTQFVVTHIDMVPKELIEKAKGNIGVVLQKFSQVGKNTVLGVFDALSTLSSIAIKVGFAAVFAFLLSADYDRLKFSAEYYVPQPIKKVYMFVKENIVKGLVGYIKAQLVLIGITFVVVLIALFLLDVENFFTIALLAGLIDVLPLLGITVLFVPWISYLFITGDVNLALWILALYGIVAGTRQMLEPKITGDSIGVGAFEMFVTMMICVQFFGVLGLFMAPIVVVTFKALWNEGYIKKWFSVK